jgi:hypothetical protein
MKRARRPAGLAAIAALLAGGAALGHVGSSAEEAHALSGALAGATPQTASTGIPPAAGNPAAATVTGDEAPASGNAFQPELGLPTTGVVAIGASPAEAPGEAWAYGPIGSVAAVVEGKSYSNQYVLLEHVQSQGWQVVPLPANAQGGVLTPETQLGAFAGQATPAGGVVLLTNAGIVTRDPGEKPLLAPSPTPETGVPGDGVSSTYAAIDEAPDASGLRHTGVLVVADCPTKAEGAATKEDDPTQAEGGATKAKGASAKVESEAAKAEGQPKKAAGEAAGEEGEPAVPCVLHYNGHAWTQEQIALPHELIGTEDGLAPKALACGPTSATPEADSAQNCWMLAAYKTNPAASTPNRLALFRRAPASDPAGYTWELQPVSDSLGPPAGSRLLGASNDEAVTVTPLPQGAQMLTVTSQGVWVDFQAQVAEAQSPVDVSELVTAPALLATAGSAPAAAPGSTSPAATGSASSVAAGPTSSAAAESTLPAAGVLGAPWCYPTLPSCPQTLGVGLPIPYRSFAWPGAAAGNPGTRIITGLPNGALLELSGGSFSEALGSGGEGPVSAPAAAAFSTPQEGWIADGANPNFGFDLAGQSQVIEVSTHLSGDELGEESVPFRQPLLAVAQAPGSAPGDPNAQAIAVGVEGEIARYTPGQGWRPETLYNSTGVAQPPTLRGVAWPEPGRAYAVGDNGTMWLWRAETGLWEPDPAKPFNLFGNLTAIAFSPTNPDLGYAVGKQGVLLRYGKSWEQVELPPELQQANFSSVTFAGGEALATYHMAINEVEIGGLAVQEGSEPWHVDKGAAALLAEAAPANRLLSKAAGLPDGGAVAAGPGVVIERDSLSAPWQLSAEPLPEAQDISALAAYRDPTGAVRAIVSIDRDHFLSPDAFGPPIFHEHPWGVDAPPPTGADQPPFITGPDPLPLTGYVLKETAGGWSDMEHESLPNTEPAAADVDAPFHPDPVFALLVDPSGNSGLAIGGQTGDFETGHPDQASETAAAMRFPASAASPNGATAAPVMTTPGNASFAVGGQAACVSSACAGPAYERFGPVVWLEHAVQSANQIAASSPGGLRAFLYTGSSGGVDIFGQVRAHYSESLPLLAPGFAWGAPSNDPFYSFATGGGGPDPVRVIVLGAGEPAGWLMEQLKQSQMPAIVIGNSPPTQALEATLLQGEASAYFYDSPETTKETQIGPAGESIPAYGTGTLGYVSPGEQFTSAELLGSSGYLLAEVDDAVVSRPARPHVVRVTAQLVPNISQLALDATDGLLLRRSHVALFQAIGRRPAAGVEVGQTAAGKGLVAPELYDRIPLNCQGASCGGEVPTDYTFASSNPDIGNFVAHEPGSFQALQVELGPNKLPVADPHSGLFCAFNAGTTTVSITTGGLTYSEPVTVQAGSVEYPCGTVPLRNPPLAESTQLTGFPSVPLAGASPPQFNPQIQTIAPPPPPPALVPPRPHPAHARPQALIPFLPLAPPAIAARAVIVPPPAPPVARPIPPSGTSQVYQSAVAPQDEREEESATSVVGVSEFSAYHADEHGGPGPWLLLLVVIAAGAGTGIRSGMRSRARGRPAYARAHARGRSY